MPGKSHAGYMVGRQNTNLCMCYPWYKEFGSRVLFMRPVLLGIHCAASGVGIKLTMDGVLPECTGPAGKPCAWRKLSSFGSFKCVKYEFKFYTVLVYHLNKLSVGVVGRQAFLYSELSSCSSKAKALLFVCLSLCLGDQVNFPRLGGQAEGNATEKEVEHDACLY